MKRLLTEAKVFLLSFIGSAILKLLFFTIRSRRLIMPPGLDEASFFSEPVVFIFWHCQLMSLVGSPRVVQLNRPDIAIHVLVSKHGDGRIIGNGARAFGMRTVHGSSTRGGVGATLAMVECLKAGGHIAITPDGPKGPAEYLKDGALRVAELSGKSIVVLAAVTDRFWQFGSWDKMRLPKPFSKMAICFSEHIKVPQNLSAEEFEKLRLRIQDEMNILTKRAEENV